MPKTWMAKMRRLVPIIAVLALLGGVATLNVVKAVPALASCSGTHCDPQGTVELKGSDWLGGNGVNVYANNGSAGYDSGVNDSVMVGKQSVQAGEEWQCVELINRLYLTEGWITSRWSGDGYTLKDNLPSGITYENNGSITYINSGDVITLSGETYGHAGVINSVTKSGSVYDLVIVNQNTADVHSSPVYENCHHEWLE
jgi:hypothetical protein